MANIEKVDLCVIGAGPAGLAAAERALAHGRSVTIIEAVEMGGVAANWGAFPALTLAASARRAFDIRHAADLAISAEAPRVNYARLNGHIKAVVENARPLNSEERLVAMGAHIIRQHATFTDRTTVLAGERRLRAKRFILATGSRPFIPDIPGLADIPYLTAETVFDLTRRPGHLIIIGAGSTGTALAQAHRRLGCEVTLIEALSPLGDIDQEFADLATQQLEAEGVRIVSNTGVVSISGADETVTFTLRTGADEHIISGTHLVLAAGRTANIETIDPEKAGIRRTANGPVLDAKGRTSNKRIYCAGDAAGGHSVDTARFMGAWAAEHAIGKTIPLSAPPILPRLTAIDPEIVSLGLSESEAQKKYRNAIHIIRSDFSELDRTRANGTRDGHIKIIALSSGRIVGATIYGENAGEIAGIFALAVGRKVSLYELSSLLVPYPALSQILPKIAEQYAADHRQPHLSRFFATIRNLLP